MNDLGEEIGMELFSWQNSRAAMHFLSPCIQDIEVLAH